MRVPSRTTLRTRSCWVGCLETLVVLGDCVWLNLFPVFALHRSPTRTSRLHSRRARLGSVWCHCVVYGIAQPDHCEDMACDDSLHQDISPAHTVAHLSACSYPRVAADGIPAFTVTHTLPAYRTAAGTPFAIPTREAGTPARNCRRLLSGRSAHRWGAGRYMDTVAPVWTRPVAMGRLLVTRRPPPVDAPRPVDILGRARQHQRLGVESAIGTLTSLPTAPTYRRRTSYGGYHCHTAGV